MALPDDFPYTEEECHIAFEVGSALNIGNGGTVSDEVITAMMAARTEFREFVQGHAKKWGYGESRKKTHA